MRADRPALILTALLLSGSALASILVASTSTLEVSVRAPPVGFAAGGGASRERYVSDVTITPNATSFAATLKGRLGGDATVQDVVGLVSASGATRSVELRGAQVTNANVLIHTWTVKNGSATVATLDMRTADPSASFTIPAGSTYSLDLRLKVVRGVAASEASFTSSVWAVIT